MNEGDLTLNPDAYELMRDPVSGEVCVRRQRQQGGVTGAPVDDVCGPGDQRVHARTPAAEGERTYDLIYLI